MSTFPRSLFPYAAALLLAGSGSTRGLAEQASAVAPSATAPTAATGPVRLSFSLLAEAYTEVHPKGADTGAGIDLPSSLHELDGTQVSITGYPLPLTLEQGRARELVLLRNQQSCCFGTPPAPGEFLLVRFRPPGLRVTMDVPLALRGTFHVEPVISQGTILQLYALTDAAPSNPP